MAPGYEFASRPAELLVLVVKRLESEFPDTPSDQVVWCVQVAREPAKSASVDPAAYANIVEVLARGYLTKIQSIRAKPEQVPEQAAPPPTVEDTTPSVPRPTIDLEAPAGESRSPWRRREARHRSSRRG
jgi:hypothetical protein